MKEKFRLNFEDTLKMKKFGFQSLNWSRPMKMNFSSVFFVVCLSVFVHSVSVVGQSSSNNCVCEDVPCERNLTSSDCPNGRVIPRGDCKCCFVCAKQLTEQCNSKELPCDSDFGLVCGENNQCQGKYL